MLPKLEWIVHFVDQNVVEVAEVVDVGLSQLVHLVELLSVSLVPDSMGILKMVDIVLRDFVLEDLDSEMVGYLGLYPVQVCSTLLGWVANLEVDVANLVPL